MTYSAGLNALATVWIASSFKAEHREAVEWLNRVTNQEANFFALEVACLKIDESLPAADFNVVAGPSSWPPTEVDTMTPRAQLWLEFWTAFNEYLEACCRQIKSRKAVRDSWCSFRSGIPNLSLVVEFPKGGYLYAELYSFGGHKDLFSKLEENKARVVGVMGEDVGFFNRKDRQYSGRPGTTRSRPLRSGAVARTFRLAQAEAPEAAGARAARQPGEGRRAWIQIMRYAATPNRLSLDCTK